MKTSRYTEQEVWGSVLPGNSYYKKGVANTLAQIAYDTFNGESGEIDLIVTIIIEAAKDRDWEYLNSRIGERYLTTKTGKKLDVSFENYCELIGLNHLTTLRTICGVTDYFDFGVGEIDPSLLSKQEEEEDLCDI